MDRLLRLEIIEELKQLKARYFYYLDSKDWTRWRQLFATDAVMDISSHFPDLPDPSIHNTKGADAIVKDVSTRLQETITAHHGHCPIFDVKNETEASGIWAMEENLFMPDGSRLDGFGHYHEDYKKIDGSWRIAMTKLTSPP
jgi:hypothetical protein